ncbi:hypothetical protein [Stutzerimonas balearica]|uniref:hypothetical protein n=1 Tax=Stutzerimonas balearica TaxID=74829 RepID=UPI003786FFD7
MQFFNEFGFNDSYGQGFPSRWMYTDERLSTINGTPELDKCIKQLFSPINFIGRIQELDNLINDLNQYLAFDKWRIVRNGADISFKRLDKVEVEEPTASNQENTFLNREFSNISIYGLGLEGACCSGVRI